MNLRIGAEIEIIPIFKESTNITDKDPFGGFQVQVGCVRTFYATKDALIKDLDRYLTYPAGVEQIHRFGRDLNRMDKRALAQWAQEEAEIGGGQEFPGDAPTPPSGLTRRR